jgi:DNA-binding winged helix-turn-helix (wHTH) protein
MDQTGGVRVVFGAFDLDMDVVELRRHGEVVAMEPKVFDVLVYLVCHRDRVVPKEELLDGVWGDRFVSESTLSSAIRHVRRALGDDGTAQRYVKTAHGRGYRFVAEVTSIEVDHGTPSGSAVSVPVGDIICPLIVRELFGRDEAVRSAAVWWGAIAS